MKNKSIIVILLLLIISVTGCTKPNEKKEPQVTDKKNVQKLPDIKNKEEVITENDINAGKEIIRNYYDALKNKDLQKIETLLGDFKDGLYNKENIAKPYPELISIDHPGRFTNDLIPPTSYERNYGNKPFKSTNFYVRFKENGEEKAWDYALIKATETSNWEIHDWGY